MDNKPRDGNQQRIGNVIVVDPQQEDYGKLVSSAALRNLQLQFFISGDEAIRSSSSMLWDLWLVNMHLPDMSGIELMSLVRQRDPQAVLFLVGNSHAIEDEITARSAGPTAYVCKPPHAVWLSGISPGMRTCPTSHVSSDSTFVPTTANY